jgi:hypothetical protein
MIAVSAVGLRPLGWLRRQDHLPVCPRHDGAGEPGSPAGALCRRRLTRLDQPGRRALEPAIERRAAYAQLTIFFPDRLPTKPTTINPPWSVCTHFIGHSPEVRAGGGRAAIPEAGQATTERGRSLSIRSAITIATPTVSSMIQASIGPCRSVTGRTISPLRPTSVPHRQNAEGVDAGPPSVPAPAPSPPPSVPCSSQGIRSPVQCPAAAWPGRRAITPTRLST